MTASLATLNGRPITSARVQIPAWGRWWAEVECASGDVLTGAATLKIDDVTFVGTILTGGVYETRTRYRIVAGAGGWGREVGAVAHTNDLGVKASTVVRDVAKACGETLGNEPSGTVGPAYVRPAGVAAYVLEDLAPRAWYVDEAGSTRFGRRASAAWTGQAARMVADAAAGKTELAPATLTGLLPGAIVDGIEAVDVEIRVSPESGVRATLWGARGGSTGGSRIPDALRRIVEGLTAAHRFFAPWEYRVVLRSADRVDLQTVRASSGMPDLRGVRIRQGSAGVRVYPKLGALCVVAFLDGDPGRPIVTSWDDQDSDGGTALELALRAGTTGSAVVEHATSAEALVAMAQTLLATIGPAIGGGFGAPVTALSVAPAFDAIVTAAAAQPLAATTKTALLAALASKSPDTTGQAPSLGWPAVRGG